MNFARALRYRGRLGYVPCDDVAPGYGHDGLTVSMERRYAQRCNRPIGHRDSHSDGHSTWPNHSRKGER